MEYRASSVALSQKLSNGHSIYDGVFSSPATKFNVSSFSSSVDDYSEIFGGVGGRRGSLIPVLEVPELHERKASVDVRSSQLDYSKVFSGFGDSDFAVPYEELFGEPKKRNTRTRAESSSLPEEVDPASPEGSRVPSQEASYESFDSAKKFNMSYHKSNHRSKSFTGGTMLHAVPAYTCLVDEVASTPVRMTEGDKPVPSPKENGACFDNNLCERVPEGNNDMKTTRDHLAGGAKVQKSFDRKRSISNVELFSAREIGQGTPPSNRTPVSSPLSEGNVEFEKRMASSFGFSKRNVFEASESVHSPPYFDEEVETSSVAAASAAALMKAIEEAQARINMAKELKERKKGGLQNRGKLNFSNDTLLDVRKGGKFSDIASIPKERKTQELHEEAAAPIKAGIPKERKTRELQDEAVAPVKARIPKERKTRELQGEAAPPVKASIPKERKTQEFQEAGGPVKASIPKERKIQEVPKERKTREFQEAAGPVKASIPKERKIQDLNDVVAAPFKFSDIASKSKERTTQKLYEEVVAPVQFTDKASLRKERKIRELLDEVAAPVKFSDEASISKERKAEELHDEVAARVKFADEASILKARKTEELHEEVIARVKFPDEACIPRVRKTEELHEEVAAGVKFEDEACIPKVRKTEELNDVVAAPFKFSDIASKSKVRKTEELNDVVAAPFKFSDIASKSKERTTQELYEQVVAPVQFTDKASLRKERKIQELLDEVAASVKFSDEASISQERKAEELHDEVAAPVKFADEASILKARKTEELHEEVAARVKFPDEACIPKVRKTEELHEEVAAGVKFEDEARIPKVSKTEELHEEVAARIKFVDEASILKVRKTEELHEEVAARVKFADEACIPEVRKTEELHEEADACLKFADEASIPKVRKTEESHEEVPAPVDVSTGPEQVTAAFEGVGKLFGTKEYGGKIEEKGSKSTETHHRQEEVDASEAGEQFYEFADTDEPDFTEAAEHFYEFSDTSEPDVSEAAELFYEFSDSSEHQATSLELDEACTVGQFEDEDEQKMKKTTIESFENPDLEGERLQAAEDEENREIEERLNADGGLCKCEENAHELETAQEPFDQKANEKRVEASREHEETDKFKASQVEEIFEEKPVELKKQKGDNKQLETQEFQEASHVKRISMAPDWVEYENIGEEACKHEELEREQKHIHMEEDTEKSFNKDNRQEIMEKALNDFNSKEEYEKRDESKSLEATEENEIVLEWDACQKKECEEGLKESFQCVEAEGTHILIDPSTEEEKVKVAREDLKNPECNSELANNLCEQGDSQELNIKQEPAGHVEEYVKDVAKTPEVPAHEEVGVTVDITEILVELRENGHQLESFDEDNGMVQKEIHETDALAAGVKVAETEKKVEDTTEIHSSNDNGTTVDKNDVSFGQNQDQVAREPEVVCNFEEHVEEVGDMNKGTLEAEVAVKQEDKNNAKPSHRKRWFDEIDVSETLIKLKETVNQSESAEDENVVEEKEISETDGLVPCVKLAEILKQMEDPIDPHLSESDEINVDRNAMSYGQDQDDQLPRDPIGVCNLEKHVEEFEGIQKDPMEPEVSVNQEENKSNSKSSHRKRWFGDGNNTEVAQLSNLLRRKGGNVLLDHEMDTALCTRERKEIRETFLENQRLEENEENQQTTRTVDTETIDCSLSDLGQEKSEDHQTTSSTEESETSHSSQKNVKEGRKENRQETTAEMCETSDNLQKEVVIEKGCIIQKDNTKGREREKVKERKAVERVIREARERAFVEARERAAETRQRVMAEAQERLGKTSAKANDISLAEKASKEAKLKAERAAVERATVEARDRALEKALSGKSSYETGKQATRSVSEKFSAASRDDGMKLGVSASDPESKASFPSSTSRYPASSSQGDPCTAERSGGTNGESAQRNKAKMERNERTAERAAKALAEKNMRDLLVQKEQAERNRIAETLDAEVKRWSSGKERNLRAMLSTLQYVLGPDSGWQPIPLTDVVTAVAVKKAYRKAALFVHPDKLQQRGASIQQKYICEKVFDLLKEAWNRFNVDER